MTDLQRLCFYALEDMTLVELNDKYFDGLGIGYTKRVVAGQAKPLLASIFIKRFEQKYQDMVAEHHKVMESSRWGW